MNIYITYMNMLMLPVAVPDTDRGRLEPGHCPERPLVRGTTVLSMLRSHEIFILILQACLRKNLL